MTAVVTKLPRASASECPQLAKADVASGAFVGQPNETCLVLGPRSAMAAMCAASESRSTRLAAIALQEIVLA
jgi:hypothetical protein